MRKAFWCGAVGLVAGVGAVYLAAAYAERHPESWFGRCVTKPVLRRQTVAQRQGSLMAALSQAVVAAYQKTTAEMNAYQACKVHPQAMVEECPENPSVYAPAVEATEPIQVTDTAPEPYSPPQTPCASPMPEEQMVMPVCPEEKNPSCPMPYAEDGMQPNDDYFPFSTWFSWLQDRPHKKGSQEESEMVPQAEPMVPATDPTYPAYPFPPGVDPVSPPGLPNCQESPYHQHQYPGCPYMGGCPYGGGRCSPPPVQEPTPPKALKKKKKKKLKLTPASLIRKLKKGIDAEEIKKGEAVPRLDTMECRPSDIPYDDKDI
jgi:hypothetical protein